MTPEFGSPRTAIVTGGAKRIGAAMARALAADGWHVLVHCHASCEEADEVCAAIEAAGGSASVVAAELAEPKAAETILAATHGLPPVGLLVNNASLFQYDTQVDFGVEQWDHHMDVNLRAPALLAQKFSAAVQGNALIVNLLDVKLFALNPDFYSYTVSKYGLLGLTELQARALAPRIRVCGIAPAVTMVSGPQSRENFDAAHTHNPLGRGVTAEDIVRALRFIVETPVLTGQVITLDAGQRLMGMPRDVAFMVESK